jgi:hypothetical protein
LRQADAFALITTVEQEATMILWTQQDSIRGLILLGYTSARIGDLQFERAAFIGVLGLAMMAAAHWIDQFAARWQS